MKPLIDIFHDNALHSTKWFNYFAIYEKLFAQYRGKEITFCEVGVLDGGSLVMWREFFGPQARIIGIDNNPECKLLEKLAAIEIIIGDQADPNFWQNLNDLNYKIDILLDDGGHTNKQQIVTLYHSLELINDGGLIVMEDTHASYINYFGNPSKYSFIEYSKYLVDVLNSRFFVNPTSTISTSVHSIQFFESIVCFSISRKDCIRNSKLTTQVQKELKDLRFKGNKTMQKLKLVRSIKFPMRLKIFKTLINNVEILAQKFQNFPLRSYFKK
jgi:hypothetical protein